MMDEQTARALEDEIVGHMPAAWPSELWNEWNLRQAIRWGIARIIRGEDGMDVAAQVRRELEESKTG
jgi:hypothetical protein